MGRVFNGVSNNSIFDGRIYTILAVWNPAVLIDQSINSTLFNGLLVTIEGIPRHTHKLAGFGYVTELLSQIQQTGFVFYDGIVTLKHREFPLLRY
ncbi:hypothetical protein BpHYR1_034042 [Brachionus plicatilis]|uniref:Uncharacterized protein n=1 Tax=Brachionus plicatilis TaxID=10195 RepID=A0A3M7PZ53_BRAPC|nr:hypothetical protein BpHYR1_034042 [Brachionus plicatilis]